MIWTLQTYIFRELLKSFGLTVLALSALFAMGGGLYNVMQYEGVTTGDLFRVLPMLIPIVITVTMPLAALFSATMVYGRLAADNELTACRAAGVNVHRLFLPAVLLALGVSIFSMFSMNVMIPQALQQIVQFAKSNVRDLAFARIRQTGYLHSTKLGDNRYILTASAVRDVSEGALIEKGFEAPGPDVKYFWVDWPTYIEVGQNDQLERFIVADGALCMFDTRSGQVRVTVHVPSGRHYESGRSGRIERQTIAITAPFSVPLRPGMLDLATLRTWRNQPWQSPKLHEKLETLVHQIALLRFYTIAVKRLSAGQPLHLHDDHGLHYELRAASAAAGEDSLELSSVQVQQMDGKGRIVATFDAPRARVEMSQALSGARELQIDLSGDRRRGVSETLHAKDGGPVTTRKETRTFENLALSAELAQAAEPPTFAEIVHGDPPPVDERLTENLSKVRRDAARLERKVEALIHFRLAFAGSSLVTVVMGAILGVIFRGSRALAAFGLACIPFGSVTLVTLVGRQLIEGTSASLLGIAIIWGGLLAAGAGDGMLLRLGVRR
jgi:lipopolysaccharide export LptBFGC system permease protein LptF